MPAIMTDVQKSFDLGGRVALVTSAGSGIGQSFAIGRAEAGADITADAVRKLGRRPLALEGSVNEPEAVAVAVSQIERDLGPLEIAVNNAGIANSAPSEETSLALWQNLYDVKATGVFLSCQSEAKVMPPRKRGLNQAHCNSSKAAIIHMWKSLTMEWADRGVRVNVISPGDTLTPMNKRPEVADRPREFAAGTPMQRIAESEEMAGPAVFLASDASSFITSHDLIVDGGFVCW